MLNNAVLVLKAAHVYEQLQLVKKQITSDCCEHGPGKYQGTGNECDVTRAPEVNP